MPADSSPKVEIIETHDRMMRQWHYRVDKMHKRRMTNHSRNTLHEIENHRVHNRMQRRITKKRARERTNSNMISPFAEQ
uniref:Uncharacterized protein n=1 Tax=Pristionchus pacificus TaxID=54126 RepID=A0A2A6B4T6_PRIPA|eukprot:PDM60871.1 hypothetical protein PRIPAC_54677 [Pristionchus pacificus]